MTKNKSKCNGIPSFFIFQFPIYLEPFCSQASQYMQVTRLHPWFQIYRVSWKMKDRLLELSQTLREVCTTRTSPQVKELPTTHLGKPILSKPNQKSQDKSIVLAGLITAAMFSETVKMEVSSNCRCWIGACFGAMGSKALFMWGVTSSPCLLATNSTISCIDYRWFQPITKNACQLSTI